jgi:hypothetical protein
MLGAAGFYTVECGEDGWNPTPPASLKTSCAVRERTPFARQESQSDTYAAACIDGEA